MDQNNKDTNTGGTPGAHRPPPPPLPDDRTRVRDIPPRPPVAEGGHAPAPNYVKKSSTSSGGRSGKRRKKPSVAKKVLLNIVKTGFVIFCIGLIVGSIIAAQMVQFVVGAISTQDQRVDLENLPLSFTSYIKAWDEDTGEWITYQELVGPEYRIWKDLDQIPQYMIDALVSTEDRSFYEHHGVDFKRTIYAAANEILGFKDKSFGASTLDQQLIKNLTGDNIVVGEDGKMSGYMRKLREIFSAWTLRNAYTPDMVMEAYLNTMPLSGTIAGVQAGALEYFNKDVSELTLWECATIAGITRAPTYYSPFRDPEVCKKRRDDVIFMMLDNGKITQAQADEAWAQDLVITRGSQQPDSARTTFSYFSDAVFNQVVEDLMKQYDITRSEARHRVYTGGYTIYATVDLKLQAQMEELYYNGYNEDGFFFTNWPNYERQLTVKEQMQNSVGNDIGTRDVLPQSAAATVRIREYGPFGPGSLAAVVGGIGPKETDLTFNRAIDGVRQVGSSMKPISAYALGIDFGAINYSSMLPDTGVRARAGDPSHDAAGNPILNWPKNFSGFGTGKLYPVVSAVSVSLNTVAVRVGERVGIPDMFDFLQNTLQITSLIETGPVNDMDLGPLVLGSQTNGISPYEMAAAYQIFGNGGTFYSRHCYTQVVDSHGSIVLEPEKTREQAISRESSFIMNRILSTVIKGGAPGVSPTAGGMMPKGEMDAVGKTGTTSDDNDRWFLGVTPYFSTAVWWGYDEKHDFITQRWPAGARNNPPIHVWKTLMEQRQETMEPISFPEKPEKVTEAAFCLSSGLLAGEGCPRGPVGYYNENIPTGVPDVCDWDHSADAEAPAE